MTFTLSAQGILDLFFKVKNIREFLKILLVSMGPDSAISLLDPNHIIAQFFSVQKYYWAPIVILQNLAEILSDRETIAHIMQNSLGTI